MSTAKEHGEEFGCTDLMNDILKVVRKMGEGEKHLERAAETTLDLAHDNGCITKEERNSLMEHIESLEKSAEQMRSLGELSEEVPNWVDFSETLFTKQRINPILSDVRTAFGVENPNNKETVREEVRRQVALDVLGSLGLERDPDQSKFSKDRAGYHHSPDIPPEVPDDSRCGQCAHFIDDEGTELDGPMCKVVEGVVHEDDVCTGFYSDIGIFAGPSFGAGMEGEVRISSFIERGGIDDWSDEDLQELVDDIVSTVDRNRG